MPSSLLHLRRRKSPGGARVERWMLRRNTIVKSIIPIITIDAINRCRPQQ